MMVKITQFTLQSEQHSLMVETAEQQWQFSYEYLRVYSPAQQAMKQALVGHKKTVKLLAIESLGSHGFRLIFDDHHNSIFTPKDFQSLAVNFDSNWQKYTKMLGQHHLTREAKIDITNLS